MFRPLILLSSFGRALVVTRVTFYPCRGPRGQGHREGEPAGQGGKDTTVLFMLAAGGNVLRMEGNIGRRGK